MMGDISRSGKFPDQGYFQIRDICRLGIFPDWGYFHIWDISCTLRVPNKTTTLFF